MKLEMSSTISSAVTSNVGGLAAFMISFFTPIFPAMIAAGALIGIDTLTGIMKSKKKGMPITSRKLSAVLTKMLLYQVLIISAHLSEVYMVAELPFVKLVLGAIALVEFKSILENASSYLGKDVAKAILEKLGRKAKPEGEN